MPQRAEVEEPSWPRPEDVLHHTQPPEPDPVRAYVPPPVVVHPRVPLRRERPRLF